MLFNAFYCIIVSYGFAFLFNMRGKNTLIAAFGGGLAWYIYLLCLHYKYSITISLFFGALTVGIYAELMARKFKCPVTTYTICGIIPLVPGNGMYYTMYYTISGKINEATLTGIQTLISAGSIAIAIVFVSSITKLVTLKRRTI